MDLNIALHVSRLLFMYLVLLGFLTYFFIIFLFLGLLFPYWFAKAIIILKILILWLLYVLQILLLVFHFPVTLFTVILTVLSNRSFFPLWFWCFALSYMKIKVYSDRNIYLNFPSFFYLLCLTTLTLLPSQLCQGSSWWLEAEQRYHV